MQWRFARLHLNEEWAVGGGAVGGTEEGGTNNNKETNERLVERKCFSQK